MLVINQQLDKLTAMHTDFVAHGMLPVGHPPRRSLSANSNSKQVTPEDDNDDNGGSVEEDVLGHVVLACTRGKPISLPK